MYPLVRSILFLLKITNKRTVSISVFSDILLALRGDEMYYTDVGLITANADEIEINPRELAIRLGTDREYDNETLELCRKRLMGVLSYKCTFIKTAVSFYQEPTLGFSNVILNSKSLWKNLYPCKEAFIIASTAGIGVDRLLSRLKIESLAEYYMTDALASAAIESFMDHACDRISENVSCVPRFSPGYGDLTLKIQPSVLERLNAYTVLGITLDSSLLMTPAKSITAIMGIKDNEKNN